MVAKRRRKLSEPVTYALYKGKLMPKTEVLEKELGASEASAVAEMAAAGVDPVPEKPKRKRKTKAEKQAEADAKEAAELAEIEAEIAKMEADEAENSEDEGEGPKTSDFEVDA